MGPWAMAAGIRFALHNNPAGTASDADQIAQLQRGAGGRQYAGYRGGHNGGTGPRGHLGCQRRHHCDCGGGYLHTHRAVSIGLYQGYDAGCQRRPDYRQRERDGLVPLILITGGLGAPLVTTGSQTWAAVTLNTAAALTATTVNFGGTLTGGSNNLTVTGNGSFAGVSGVGALVVED